MTAPTPEPLTEGTPVRLHRAPIDGTVRIGSDGTVLIVDETKKRVVPREPDDRIEVIAPDGAR